MTMDKGDIDNMTKADVNESSSYLISDETDSRLDFGGLFSPRFSNIMPLYSSTHGPTELYTATRYGKRFVLKGLKEQYRSNPIYKMALTKEFEIGILLDHPSIRRTLGFEAVDGLGDVIILEYIDGLTLETLMKSEKLTSASVRSISKQIADGLDYIHTKQVFHRDLKPSNILISHQGHIVKIIDFNLSDSNEFIVLKNPAGSRKYMAPEQLTPDAKPSAASDIYSFGVVTRELAEAGRDDNLADIAAKCSNPDPNKRPQSLSVIKLPTVQSSALRAVSGFLASKVLTYIMICVCLALAALISYLLINPHN